jgi:hypothetical protein
MRTTTHVVLGESDTVFQQRIETGLRFTPADVRNHREYPIELGGVWKFRAD